MKSDANKDVVVLGLPGSGKTTFLAAFWHVVTSGEVDARLKLTSLRAGEASYLRAISDRWLGAKEQERTFQSGGRTVTLALHDGNTEFQLSFPDLAGESFQQMWETRDCDDAVAASLRSAGVMLFIHADRIKSPGWIVDDLEQYRLLGLPVEPGSPIPWHPRLAPTQVQLVDLLQSLQSAPFDVGPRRVAVILSAWDRASAEGLAPEEYLARHLPLLSQYLQRACEPEWTVRIYGVSAQGGKYDELNGVRSEEADRMRAIDVPSRRIKVVDLDEESHDLTAPLHWLLG
jgi:hypothetical protein